MDAKVAAKDAHNRAIKDTVELVTAKIKAPKPEHAKATSGDSVVDFMEKLQADAQAALVVEKERLDSLSSRVQTLCSKLRTELASGNTARLLCRTSSTHVAVASITSQWALPRIKFSKETVKRVSVEKVSPPLIPPPVSDAAEDRPMKAASSCDGAVCSAVRAVKCQGSAVSPRAEIGSGKEMDEQVDSRVNAPEDQMPMKRNASSSWDNDDEKTDKTSEMKKPKTNGTVGVKSSTANRPESVCGGLSGAGSSRKPASNLEKIPTCNAVLRTDSIGKFEKADKEVLAKFVLGAQLQGRLPILTIGAPRAAFSKPCDVAFDKRGSLLIADCLNDRIEVFDLELGDVARAVSGGASTSSWHTCPARCPLCLRL